MAQQAHWKKYISAVKYTASSATTGTVYTPTSGSAFRMLGYSISSDAAQTVTLLLGGTAFLIIYTAANGGANISSPYPIVVGTANQLITATTSASGNCSVTVWGYED